MAALTLANSHNMVAYLEKSEANANFAEIVDFLNASPIRYALTVVLRKGETVVGKGCHTAACLDAEQDRVNTPRSDEERIELKELMDMCTKLSDRVLDLENVKDAQALEIKKLKKNKSLGEKDASKQGRNSDKTKELNVAEDEPMFDLSDLVDKDSTTVDVSVGSPTRLVDDLTTDDVTLAETLIAIRRSASRPQKLKGVVVKEPTRKKLFEAKRDKEQRNKPPTKAEQRKKMCTYMKHMVNDFVPMDTESSGKKVDSSGKKAESSKKRTRAVLGKESVKRQKVEDDAEKAELKACLEIVLGDDSAVNIESLATKYPIIFSAMLDDFGRQDVLDLYRLVKERFETTSLEGHDRLLWGDLITLFEPIEKKYPLTQEMLSRMLSGRLEVDHECEMAFELLRFTRSQLKK
ncbi:hypothetical protein Tco_0730514 [Tanacetum coccineum]|uniref:Uncharacterized protein n=1 Tax=Tanacetum coccineum TaxID=301880 RepID=A0ABQ4YVH5_9ASTR